MKGFLDYFLWSLNTTSPNDRFGLKLNKNTMENFNEIINGNQLTLVDFFATWCGPCKMMHPVLEQLKENFGDSIRILKIDVDKAQELAMNYRIQSVPTLMLFREGQQLWRQSGAMPLAELTNIINSYKQ